MDRWNGKIAVVTGASSGIGAATAEKLVELGLQVVGVARRKDRLEELASKLVKRKGKLIPFKADFSKADEIIAAFKWIAENVGPVSILINNAGTARSTPIVNGDIEKWRLVLDINFFGLTVATREAIKIMQDNKIDGHIINVNSILGHFPTDYPGVNIYPATKFAVKAFTESLRKELVAQKSKIKISSISPGRVQTEIIQVAGSQQNEEWQKKVGDELSTLYSEDVANSIVHILEVPPHVQICELIIRPVGEKL